VVSERCVDSWKSGWQLKLDHWQIPRTTRLVGNSNSVANFYRDQKFPDELIRVVPNGIQLPAEAGKISTSERDQLRAELCGLPPNAKVVGFIGRLARQKRIMDVLWSMVLLKDVDPNFYLVLVGEGPERDVLERFARELDVESHIKFLGHRHDTTKLLPLFDVFCLASDFEGMSNSVMEAMAAGLPVIASDIAPNRELVFDGVTGYLFPVGDRAACARAILFLFEQPERAERMGTAGRQRMATEFSVQQMVNGYAQIYRDVVRK
jgi:glycosyltransferase involved in cell wall biosynthesis